MDYIHSFGIIHGDLKLGNVLLKTHRVDRRGYVAKVSDFGMCKFLCIACCACCAGHCICQHVQETGCTRHMCRSCQHSLQADVRWD